MSSSFVNLLKGHKAYFIKEDIISNELQNLLEMFECYELFDSIVFIEDVNEFFNTLKKDSDTIMLFFDKYSLDKAKGLNTMYSFVKTFLVVEQINNKLFSISPTEIIIGPKRLEERENEIFLFLQKKVINFEKIRNFEKSCLKIEHQSKEISNLFELLNNSSLIVTTDTCGRINHANDVFQKTSGYSLDEIIGSTHKLIRHPSTPDEQIKDMWRTIKENKPWHGIVRNINKYGLDYIVDAKIVPQFDEFGNLKGYLGIQYDITDLVRKNELSKMLLDEQNSAIAIGQVGNGIISSSKEFLKLFGFKDLKSMKEHKFCLLNYIDNINGQSDEEISAFTHNQNVCFYNVALKINDNIRIYDISQKRVVTAFGEYFIITLNDVTIAHKEVEDAKYEASVKSNFLATMSHEIRTPLNGMIPYVDLLLETAKLTDEQLDYVTTIKNSSEGLLRIINDILDFSKIESGKLEIENISFDPIIEFETILDLYTAKADEKEISLFTYIEPNLPYLFGDPLRIKQIVHNLLSNAIKFTPLKGEIIFYVEDASKNKNSNKIELNIYIKDSGRGIEPEHQVNIFTPFSQADNSISRKFGGTGLGLSICKNLATLMNGEILLESKIDKGSKFSLKLELEIDTSKCNKKYRHKEVEDKIGIYVVNENDYRCETLLLCKYLKAMNFVYKKVSSKDDSSDCEILFILSSGNDTIDFLDEVFIKNKKIITIIGSTVQNRNKFSSNAVINMPLNGSKIFDAILDTDKLKIQTQKLLSNLSSVEKYDAHILVAEDNSTNQKLIRTLLAKHDIKVDIADNGKIAVEKYNEFVNTGASKYDLIFLDIHMPIMDGTEAIAKIREIGREINIVALTADAIKAHQQKYFELGFDDFLAKPIEKAKFESILRKFLSHLIKPNTSLVKNSINESDKQLSNDNTSLYVFSSNKSKIDEICENLDLDIETSQMLLDDFMDNWNIFKKELEMALEDKNIDKIREVAHSIKGASGSLMLNEVYEICKTLEEKARGKNIKDMPILENLIIELKKSIEN